MGGERVNAQDVAAALQVIVLVSRLFHRHHCHQPPKRLQDVRVTLAESCNPLSRVQQYMHYLERPRSLRIFGERETVARSSLETREKALRARTASLRLSPVSTTGWWHIISLSFSSEI